CQKFARWNASMYCVVPTLVPPGLKVMFLKIGEFMVRATGVCVSPQAFATGDRTVPLANLSRIGTITTGILVVAEPAAGFVPTIVNLKVVVPTLKVLLQSGTFTAANACDMASSAFPPGITTNIGFPCRP